MKVLGRIEKRNSFYNFFLQYRIEENGISPMPYQQCKQDYPTLGGINLAHDNVGESKRFLDNLSTDDINTLYPQNAYIVEFENEELENNLVNGSLSNYYAKKLNLPLLIESGVRLEDRIKLADRQSPTQGAAYKVVSCETDDILPQTFVSGYIFLRASDNITEGEQVVLHYRGRYYGPLTAHYRATDNRSYVRTEAAANNYLIKYYLPQQVTVFDLQKFNPNNYQNYYTPFIYVTVEPEKEDFITDDILLEKAAEDVSLDLIRESPEEFSHLCSNSPFFANLSQEIIDRRMQRLHDLIGNIDQYQKQQGQLFEALLKVFKDNPPSSFNDAVADSDIYRQAAEKAKQASTDAQRAETAEKRVRELEDELEQLKQTAVSTPEMVSAEQSAEYQAKEEEHHTLSHDIETLQEEKSNLERDVYQLSKLATKYSDNIRQSRNDVSDAIRQGARDMATIAFDPFIANQMMKAAARWDIEEEDKYYDKLNTSLANVTPSSLSGEALINHIVQYVQERRAYSRNQIINIYICLVQNFITIFSGEPGTGKTSMGNMIAETLGLLQYGEDINRFVSVSVERGWSSKRDFIGYYNPLTRRYDKSNAKVYHALRTLDNEGKKSAYPFVIMLDEANLSPIEYYWADFMRLTDRSSENDAYINIGTDKELYIPQTLHFVATINTDQTTEKLSPRLIDRASIIRLPKTELRTGRSVSGVPKEIISWEALKATFDNCSGELKPITQNVLKSIYKLFNEYGMNVSARLQICIKNYILAAQNIMEAESDAEAKERALDFAVVQKLLPKINGYYTVYERFFDTLNQICRENHLKMTEEAVKKIIEAQENNMGYCQYMI